MPRILVPSLGPTDWRRLLAEPGTQWKRGRSALELAVAWEAARNTERGIPSEVAQTLDTAPPLKGAVLALCVPEHQVQLEGGGHASQNDLWALLRTDSALASLALEARAGEPLDKLVVEWLADAKPASRKPERLAALLRLLGLADADVSRIRYQLLHRAASALLEAARFRATMAVMLIQSFGGQRDDQSWEDFQQFAKHLGADPTKGQLALASGVRSTPLYVGWTTSEPANEARLADAV